MTWHAFRAGQYELVSMLFIKHDVYVYILIFNYTNMNSYSQKNSWLLTCFIKALLSYPVFCYKFSAGSLHSIKQTTDKTTYVQKIALPDASSKAIEDHHFEWFNTNQRSSHNIYCCIIDQIVHAKWKEQRLKMVTMEYEKSS